MVRLTEADARRLGIARTHTPKAKGGKGGRARSARKDYAEAGVAFTVALTGDPKPKKRARTVTDLEALRAAFVASRGRLDAFMGMAAKGRSRTFTPKDTAEYEKVVAEAARRAMGDRKPMECPVDVTLEFVLAGDPGTWPTSPLDGDADNLEKAVMDAMNGVVFADDRLVVRATKVKLCGAEPLVNVTVDPAAP